jgi:signal transduction histidine kinase
LTRTRRLFRMAWVTVSSQYPAERPRFFSQGSTRSGRLGEGPANHVLAYALLIAILGFILSRQEALSRTIDTELADLVAWTLIVVLVNLFPVWLRESTFTMDMPILLAVALVYPPEVAALVALVGSLDIRELFGRVSVTRAVFNRSQITSLVLVAGWLFHWLTQDSSSWPANVAATLVAIAASFVLNVFWVTLYTGLRTGRPIRIAMKALREQSLGEFAATYAGYCGLALVLAYLFQEVGVWSVLLFLAPTIVAQLMLARGQRLTSLADELRGRERLLERLSDRIVDERRDERLRIAADLHDDVLQSLIRISQLGGFLVRETTPSSQAFQDAEELTQLAHKTMEELRHVVGELQQSPLGRGGLVPTLRGLARELQLVWRTRVTIQASEDPQLTPSQQVAVYQMAKEAILNALKHAHASEVGVTLEGEGGTATTRVQDDGDGFHPEGVDIQYQFGIGLMKERARMSGAQVEIDTAPGKGTTVTIRMPESSGTGPPNRRA